MLKKISNFLYMTLFVAFLASMIAQPVLEYQGVDRHGIDTLLLIRKYLMYVLLAGGLVSAVLLFAPKNKDRREVMGRHVTLTMLPLRDIIVAAVIFVGAMLASTAVTMSLVKDARLQALIDGLVPFLLMGCYFVWSIRRSRKIAAERKAKSPDDVFS